MNWSLALVWLVPPALTTVTSTVPGACGGVVSTICRAASEVKLDATVVPKSTAEAFCRFVPVIVTLVPPAVDPADGDIPVTDGAGAGEGVG